MSTRYLVRTVGLAVLCMAWGASARGQATRGPGDYFDRDQYGHRYRDQVFDSDNGSFSESFPYVPQVRPRREESRPPVPRPRPTNRYRRDNIVRNDYAGAPVYRHYYGGMDRYDAPDYLDQAGRASALANGYSRRGVEEFSDGYGRGVRTDDVYPLNRDVDPRRYRGRMLNGSLGPDDEDRYGGHDLEEFIRAEYSTRPGANLRVSSTGTYTMRNYIDYGNQVMARFRKPNHYRWEYGGQSH